MKTSSDVRDYAGDLPKAAPGYLREWAEKREWTENAILFKAGWIREPLTGLRERAADCVCTACGSRYFVDWISGGTCSKGAGYGIRIGNEIVKDWGKTVCPDCGREVRTIHLHGGGTYAKEAAFPVTLHRITEEGKPDRVVIVCWAVEKSFDGDGRRRIEYHGFEAYIAEEARLLRCSGHASCMNSWWWKPWEQTKHSKETMGEIREVVCPEGIGEIIAGTTLENAKLELYLTPGRNFPGAWVRIWQKHPQAENMLTCGAGEIIGNLIGQEKIENRGYTKTYNAIYPKLAELDWTQRRPWKILRMRGKDELQAAIALQGAKHFGGRTWKLWLQARKDGKVWELEDLAALEQMKYPERIAVTEIRPTKAVRYLEVQRRRWPNDRPDEIMLTDYWTMAIEGTDLMNPQNLWPERLKREHDLMIGKRDAEKNAMRDEKIAAQAKELERFCFSAGGIFIRPARSTAELTIEGKSLNHCVGSYAERVASGETRIFFIRRESDPDTSWYTLNTDKACRTVIQNRGMRNCARTPEVKEFEQIWLEWVRAGAKRDKNGKPVLPGKKEDAA